MNQELEQLAKINMVASYLLYVECVWNIRETKPSKVHGRNHLITFNITRFEDGHHLVVSWNPNVWIDNYSGIISLQPSRD